MLFHERAKDFLPPGQRHPFGIDDAVATMGTVGAQFGCGYLDVAFLAVIGAHISANIRACRMDTLRVQLLRNGTAVGSVELKTDYFLTGVVVPTSESGRGYRQYKWSPISNDGIPTMSIGEYPLDLLRKWDSFLPPQ